MGSPKKQTQPPDNGKTGTSKKARAKPKSSTILDDFICFASRTFLPVGVLDTGEQTVSLGESKTVKQAMIEAEFGCKSQDFYNAKADSNDDKETAQAFQEAEDMIDKKYRALKVETAIDISEIKLYFGPKANELCMMQCRQALVCPQGILFAEPKFDYTLFKYAAKQLGNSFGRFKLKGQGTWYLHYMTLPEIIPIFRLVGDSKKKLLDEFNEGGLFYTVGTSFMQGLSNSLDKADELEKRYNELIEAAVEDSATEYVRLGDGPKVRQKFQEIFKTPYNPDAIEAAGKAGNELVHLVPAIEKFVDAGTPAFVLTKSDEELKEEMDSRNYLFDIMLEAMGDKKDSTKIAAVLSRIQELKTNNNPKQYDEWKSEYKDIRSELDDIKKGIIKDSEDVLCKAYGMRYGKFYHNVIDEISNSEYMAFGLELGVTLALGGGSGIFAAAKYAGKGAVAGAKLAGKGVVAGAKFVGKGTINLAKGGKKKIAELIAKKGGEKTAETAAKKGVEAVAKEGAEAAAKKGVETVAKEGAEKAVETVAKEGAEAIVEEGGKKAFFKAIGKDALDGWIMSNIDNLPKYFDDETSIVDIQKDAILAGLLNAGFGLALKGVGIGVKAAAPTVKQGFENGATKVSQFIKAKPINQYIAKIENALASRRQDLHIIYDKISAKRSYIEQLETKASNLKDRMGEYLELMKKKNLDENSSSYISKTYKQFQTKYNECLNDIKINKQNLDELIARKDNIIKNSLPELKKKREIKNKELENIKKEVLDFDVLFKDVNVNPTIRKIGDFAKKMGITALGEKVSHTGSDMWHDSVYSNSEEQETPELEVQQFIEKEKRKILLDSLLQQQEPQQQQEEKQEQQTNE